MKKNIIFIPAINAGRDLHQNYGYSVESWKRWSEKYDDIEVLVWDTPLYTWEEMTIPWQRYHLFKILEHNNINYDQILMVDSDTIVNPDTPNFFELTDRKYCGVVDMGCWEWTGRSIRHYKDIFDGYNIDRGYYINCGFQIVNETHKDFFNLVLDFYQKNQKILVEKQKSGLGTDQTPVNYLIQMYGIETNILPPTYNLGHLISKNLINLGHGWWGDSLDNLYNQGWVYHFNGIPQNKLNRDMKYFLERSFTELYENPTY